MGDKPLTTTAFKDLDLAESLLRGLEAAGFTHCTPIQEESLPAALEGRDVAGQAQTGTGKTAAFLLAIFNRLLHRAPAPERKPADVRVLVLAPTRELAIQIHRDAEQLGRYTDLKIALAYGGVDYQKQRAQIAAGCDVLIGTPGRLIDYYKQKVFGLKHLEAVVLDEADRMFDLGFIKDIRYLLRRMPKPDQRQSFLFSATLSYRVMELAYEHMNSPLTVEIEPDKVTAERVEQRVFYPSNDEKVPLLLGLMKREAPGRTLIFTNTRREADQVRAWLNANGFHAGTLSGSVPQPKRQRLLKRFHDGDISILVATDVAARGLHIPDVTHVINYDLPQDAEDYVHRIGRTARLGAQGHAVSFACEDSAFNLPDIENYIGLKIPTVSVGAELLVDPERPPRRSHRKDLQPTRHKKSRRGRGGSRRRSG